MKWQTFIGFVFLFGLFQSCNKSSLSASDYISYCNAPGNGLRIEKQISDVKYTLQYEPVDYLIAKRQASDNINRRTYNRDFSDLGGLQYYVLRIEALNGQTDPLKVGVTSQNEYFKRIEYMSFQVQNDLKLLDGNDTLQCRIAHLERMYNIAPYVSVVAAFDKSHNSRAPGDKIFMYQDKVFGSGTVILTVKGSDIKNIPSLKVQS